MNINKKVTNKYYCSLCGYTAANNTNLHTHFKSQKHLLKEKDNGKISEKLKLHFSHIDEEIKNKFKKYENIIRDSDIRNLRKELNDGTTNCINFITKTLDDVSYICTECGKTFVHKHSYKTHTHVCQQIFDKHESSVRMNIELICMIKQLLDICKIEETNKINDSLTEILKSNNEKLKVKYNELKSKYKELENQKTIIGIKCDMFETSISKLQVQYEYLKEKYNKIKTQNIIGSFSSVSGNGNHNNNNNNVTIILNNNPPFEYVNPFIDATTEMPYNYKNPEEMRVLLDNQNQSKEMKAKLCNGIAFYSSYNNKELFDLVATSITVAYQKEDPKSRSIVNTDTTRNSFHVRLTDETGKINYWCFDKMGEKLSILLFKPIREYIIEAVRSYAYYCSQKFLSNKEEFTYPYTMEDHKIYRNFINGNSELFNDDPVAYKKYKQLFATLDNIQGVVRDTNFNEEILSKISAKFFLDKKQHRLMNGIKQKSIS